VNPWEFAGTALKRAGVRLGVLVVVLGGLGVVGLIGVNAVLWMSGAGANTGYGCGYQGGYGTDTSSLAAGSPNDDQKQNAAIIVEVGRQLQVPERGQWVALATAMQESGLHNLNYGDRDSLGLFQQRPSQGWGTEDQLKDPRYAAGKFYGALLKINDWQDMRVTQAAQMVQRSAYPDAYEKWADEATMLASAFTGSVPNSLTCTLVGAPTYRGAAAAQALQAGLALDWGKLRTSVAAGSLALVVAASDTQVGWQYAHWIVAHSSDNGVERVAFGGQEWSAESGSWKEVDATDATLGVSDTGARVVAEVFHN
jgi:hypothetical protein